MSSSLSCATPLVAVLTTLSLASPAASAADGLDATSAEALFREGKALLERHDYARACPLLSASVALDPATGAFLALAICNEGEGKLASAASGYERVAARAAAEHRPDRVQVARARAASITPRISMLTIVLPAEAARLERLSVLRNGVAVDANSLGIPIPLDGGEYLIEVSAAGKKPWTTTVSLKAMGDARTLAVPALEAAATLVAADSPPVPLASASTTRALASLSAPSAAAESAGLAAQAVTGSERGAPGRISPVRIAGLALMGGGIAALAAGTFYGLRAMSKNQDSHDGCNGNACDPAGKQNRLDALSAGDKSTFAFIAGGLAAAAGVTLFVIGTRTPKTAAPAATLEAPLTAGIAIGPGGGELLLRLTLDP